MSIWNGSRALFLCLFLRVTRAVSRGGVHSSLTARERIWGLLLLAKQFSWPLNTFVQDTSLGITSGLR
jgi:hypothetical protein